MRTLALLAAALLLAACEDLDGVVIMVDEGYRAEIVASHKSGLASPDGLLWSGGVLYIADEGGSAIRSWRPGEPLKTIQAGRGLASPEDVRLGPEGSLYVTDDTRGGVLRVDPDGSSSLLAPQLGATEGLAVTPQGDLLVAVPNSRRIVRLSRTGQVSPFIEPDARLEKPESMAFDEAGNLYIADDATETLHLRTSDGRLHSPVRGERFAPESLWYQDGFLYITDSKHGALHRYSPAVGLRTVALFAGDLANVQGVTGDERGALYVSVQSDLAARQGYILKLTRSRPAAPKP